jgi:hypothetical protein
MGNLRTLTATHRRCLLLVFACAMLVRALIPTGWMPIADAQGFRIVPCSGTGPMRAPLAAADASVDHVMADMHHATGVDDRSPEHHNPGADHPCAFASVTPALEAPVLAAPLPLVPVRAMPAPTRMLVGVGHGLAAPPPPPTGPPTFA